MSLRHVVPVHVRRSVMASLPPQLAEQVRAAAAQGGPGKRARRILQRRSAQAQARPLTDSSVQLRVAQLGRQAWVCVVEDGVTAAEARQRNLDLVVDVLHAAGIDYWIVDAADNRSRITVATHEDDRVQALTALRSAHADTAVYVGDLDQPAYRSRLARNTLADDVSGVRVFCVYLSTAGQAFLGASHACELEFWATEPNDGALLAPRPNRTGERIPVSDKRPATLSINERSYPTLEPFTAPRVFDITFPVDAVYTWVDGNDPAWRARKSAAMASHGLGVLNDQAANSSRFENRDELKYSLRSLEKYAPFLRKIYLVTDDQVPAWLDTANERITVVSHRELFAGSGQLPTFNSHAIESRLHHVPGLAEHYLYLNDDVCFGRPVSAETFFHANGLSKFFVSKALVDLGDPSPDDVPVLAAGKNNRAFIESVFGRTLRNKMKHTPQPQQRSVLEEMETKFPEVFSGTASHQFRHTGDYSIASSLHHYYAYLTGRAVPDDIRYVYTDLSNPMTATRLRGLLRRRDMDVFCINDTDSNPEQAEEEQRMLSEFFEQYFPERSSFELRP